MPAGRTVREQGVCRSRRAIALATMLLTMALAIVAVPAPALADDPIPDPTTTTLPTPDTTTTTVPTPDTTVPTTDTTVPTTDTTVPTTDTTTTTPPSTTTTRTDPGAATSDHHPDDALVPLPAFVNLTDGERALVERLQNANDALAYLRFALFGLVRQVATANHQLEAAQAGENAAFQREFLGLLGAVLDRKDATARALGVHRTSDAKHRAGVGIRGKSAALVRDAWLAQLDALTRRLEADRKTARRARVQAQAHVAVLNPLLAAQTQAVTDATAESAAAESAAASAFGSDAVRARPDGITAALATAQAGQTDPIVLAGLVPPIPGAALSSPFGIRIDPLGGGVGFHPGLDFGAGSGTSIHAAAAGVVVTAGDCGGYGNCVVIDHGSSVATVYAHQSEVLVGVGDQVAVGQVIGLVGSTGKSTGAHLHFEVRLHGIPIDPLPTFTT